MGEDGRVRELAVTVLGHDRPGIIASASQILSGLGVNLTDSTMTRLRGHFAMTLVCVGEPTPAEVEAALGPLSADGSLLVTVREIAREMDEPEAGRPYVLSLHGADRLGIVAAVTAPLADAGGNITDLTTRLAGDLYVLVAEVDVPSTVDAAALAARLSEIAGGLGVEASFRPVDADIL